MAVALLLTYLLSSSPAQARDGETERPTTACAYHLTHAFSGRLTGPGVDVLVEHLGSGPNGFIVSAVEGDVEEAFSAQPVGGRWMIDFNLISLKTFRQLVASHNSHRELAQLEFFISSGVDPHHTMVPPQQRQARVTPYLLIEGGDGILAGMWDDVVAARNGDLPYAPSATPFRSWKHLVRPESGTSDDGTFYQSYHSRSSQEHAGIRFERRQLIHANPAYASEGLRVGAVQHTLDFTGASIKDLAQFDHWLERFGYLPSHPVRERLEGARYLIDLAAKRGQLR